MSSLLSLITSPYFIFSSILLSSGAVRFVLKSMIGNDLNRLIFNIVMLPTIPILWWWRSVELGSSIFSFYGALFFSVILISKLIYSIIKYNSKKRQREIHAK